MAKGNLKAMYPKAFKSLKKERPKSKYTSEEKYAFFVERKLATPTPTRNKKGYNKKKERQKRY